MAQTSSLFETVIRNTSQTEKFFGFLGLRGARLAAGADFTVPGNLLTDLAARRSKRAYNSLVSQLAAGTLTVMKTPTVFMGTGDSGEVVTLAGGPTGSGTVVAANSVDTDTDNDTIPDVIDDT